MQNKELQEFIHQELCGFKDLILVEVNKIINQKFETINQKFEAIDRKFEIIDQKFKAMNQKFEIIDQKFEAMNQKFEEKFKILESKLESLTNTVTLIEHDHGEKLAILMDYMVINNEKFDKYDNDFKVLKKIIENHSMRIDEIEKSIKSINY